MPDIIFVASMVGRNLVSMEDRAIRAANKMISKITETFYIKHIR